jgi:hypothetical protein
MHNIPAYQQVSQRLEAKLKHPIHSQVFDFWDENMRDGCLGQHVQCPRWTAFYVWRFPTKIRDYEIPITTQTCNKSEMVSRSWEMHWTHFCLKMFQRQEGCMSWMGSWLQTMENRSDNSGKDMYYGAIGLRGRKMLQDELALTEKLSYEEGGIKDLRMIAADGLDMFHVRFLRPDEHSLGSHVPAVSANIRGMYPRSFYATPEVPLLLFPSPPLNKRV